MNWLSKLEGKFGKYAIRNITLYLIACYAFGYVIQLVNPGFLAYLTSNYPNVIKEIERSNDYTDNNSSIVENALKKYLSL